MQTPIISTDVMFYVYREREDASSSHFTLDAAIKAAQEAWLVKSSPGVGIVRVDAEGSRVIMSLREIPASHTYTRV